MHRIRLGWFVEQFCSLGGTTELPARERGCWIEMGLRSDSRIL
jgi:hypothetical protein